jgi:hypothetical protein
MNCQMKSILTVADRYNEYKARQQHLGVFWNESNQNSAHFICWTADKFLKDELSWSKSYFETQLKESFDRWDSLIFWLNLSKTN